MKKILLIFFALIYGNISEKVVEEDVCMRIEI